MLQALGHSLVKDDKDQDLAAIASVFELPEKAGIVIAWLSEDGLFLVFDILAESKEDCRRLRLEIAESDGCAATCLAWIPDLGAGGNPLLCVGFAHGGVSFFSHDGVVLFSFLVSSTPVIRVRHCNSQLSQETKMPDSSLMLLHDHGLVVVIETESIPKVAAAQLHEDWEDHPLEALRFSVFDLRGRAGIVDAVLLPGARSLEDPFAIKRPHEVMSGMSVVALGSQPFLSLHSLRHPAKSSGPGRSLLGTAASALGNYARSWVASRNTANGYYQRDHEGGPVKIAGFAQAREIQVSPWLSTELPVAAKFIDASRQGEVLMPAPYSSSDATRLAATCDAYGRVALFCLESLRCLQLWKGYRDAQVSWLSTAGLEKAKVGAGEGRFEDKDCGRPDLPCLVIYAPRRGLLELWHLWSSKGPKRLAASCVGSDCLLLSQGGRAYLWHGGKLDRVVRPVVGAGTSPASCVDPDSDAFDSADSELNRTMQQKEMSEKVLRNTNHEKRQLQEQLMETISGFTEVIEGLQDQCDGATNVPSADRLQDQLKEICASNRAQQAEVESLRMHLQKLSECKKAAEARVRNGAGAGPEAQVHQLKDERDMLKARLEELSSNTTTVQHDQQEQVHTQELKRLRQDVESLHNEKEQLRRQLQEQDKERQELQDNFLYVKTQLDKVQMKQAEAAQNGSLDGQKELERHRHTLQSISEERNRLAARMDSALNVAEKEKAYHEQSVERVTTANARLMEERDRIAKEVERLSSLYAQSVAQLQASLADAQSGKFESATGQTDPAEVALLRSEVEDLDATLRDREEENDALKTRIRKLAVS
ncbi:RAB3GAP2 [Symbiodinium natans]|uniref:RAB3GAP2 protein n=1 Tax=Symbiodinium natans TaxID=878477 RepID=A0A812HCC8_9DINO|nr:RAB3GAP2 [Symbiodinium natans]